MVVRGKGGGCQLMKESRTDITIREFWGVALGTVLLVGVINFAALAYLDRYSPNLGYWLLNTKWQMLLRLEQPVDWLILGDSTGNQGVASGVLRSKLGGTVLNLCTFGNALAVNDAWMLQTYINRFGPPRAVVIVHTYNVWHRETMDEVLARIPLSWGYWNRLEPSIESNTKRLMNLFLLRYFPLYSQNESLAMPVRKPLTVLRGHPPLSDDGFMHTSKALPEAVKRDTVKHIEFTQKTAFEFSEINRRALDTIQELAERYGFDVYLANGPIYRELYEDRRFQVYFAKVVERLKAWAEESARVHYILREPVTFAQQEMQNADHLISSAAPIYTEYMAAAIASVRKVNNESRGREVARVHTSH